MPCSPSRSRTERSLKRATPTTRRDGDARLARRASVGPILPATPRMRRSPSTVARSSTRARVGRVRKSSSASTDAKRSGRDEGSRRSTCRFAFAGPPQFSGASPRQASARVANLAPRQRETAMAAEKIVRIGGASGFWGDSRVAAPQLVASGAVDYLVFDYLAETTMAILAAARLKRPELGYATDFVEVAMRPVLGEIARRGIKVVSNAGGIHPRACVAALEAMIAAEGLALKVAVVEGDDVSAQVAALAAAGTRDIDRGERAARARAERQRLSRRDADRRRARRRRRHRRHRPRRRQRARARPADARVRLGRERPRPARRRQPRRPHHRMRLPGDRRPLHRLGIGARLGEHRLPDRRVPRRRHVPDHQAGRHRRADRARRGRRAAALRDRRPGRLPAARRRLRFPRRSPSSRTAPITSASPARAVPHRPTRTRSRRPRWPAFAAPARSSSSASTR